MFSILKIGAFWCLLSGVVVYSFCRTDNITCDFQEYKDKIEKLETELTIELSTFLVIGSTSNFVMTLLSYNNNNKGRHNEHARGKRKRVSYI